ncbi:transposase [Falsiroseomonas sp. HW251]|uniref:transposase n=1 Tax=Falsiroseomonas sp. HW251 TaxID=3390998 RepID=UPI003D3158E0
MAVTLHFPLRPTEPHPFAPMTEPEWAVFAPYVAERLGRPPKDLRATWDAIFHVVVTGCSWQALAGGRVTPGAAHAALARAARNGLLDRLVCAVSRHPFAPEEMAGFEWRIVRAVRRIARQARPETLYLAAGYGLESALPWPADRLPRVPAQRPGSPPSAWVPRLPPIPFPLLRGRAAPLPPPAEARMEGRPSAPRRRAARRVARLSAAPPHRLRLGLKC